MPPPSWDPLPLPLLRGEPLSGAGAGPGLPVDVRGFRLVAALYLALLGLGLALLPADPGDGVRDIARGVASVGAALLLLWAGVVPLRFRASMLLHGLVAAPQVAGAYACVIDGRLPGAATLALFAAGILVLPFGGRGEPADGDGSGVSPGDGAPRPNLVAIVLGAVAVAWGGLQLLEPNVAAAAAGLPSAAFLAVIAVSGAVVVAQEFLAVPLRWRAPAQVVCGLTGMAFAALAPIFMSPMFWLLNLSAFVRTGGLVVLPWVRGHVLLEGRGFADRLSVALISAAVVPLTVVVTYIVHGTGDRTFTALEQNVIFATAALGAVGFGVVAWFGALGLSRELEEFGERVSQIPRGVRGPFTRPEAIREVNEVSARLEAMLGELDEASQERARLVARLQSQNAELERANAAKDEFLHLVSHELRTPLTIVTANARLLSTRMERLEPAVISGALDDVHDASRRLEAIVEDLLTLARPEHGLGLDIGPVRLRPAVDEAVRMHHALHPLRPLRVDARDEPLVCEADLGALIGVVTNLLNNAQKYSPDDEPIELQLSRVAECVRFVVADRGLGISEAEAARLFEPFYRAPNIPEATPGLGIGLAVSRKLVEAMRGRISARPRPGGGSEFEVVLPHAAYEVGEG